MEKTSDDMKMMATPDRKASCLDYCLKPESILCAGFLTFSPLCPILLLNSIIQVPAVADFRYRVLWHNTKHIGYKLYIPPRVKNYLQPVLPTGLRQIPSYTLHYGSFYQDRNHIRLDEFDFMDGIPGDVPWDLYFLDAFLLTRDQRHVKANLMLVPRYIFDWNGPTGPTAVCGMGWKYLAVIDASRLRLGLALALESFFGAKIFPHCIIETFLVCLPNKNMTPKVNGPSQQRMTRKILPVKNEENTHFFESSKVKNAPSNENAQNMENKSQKNRVARPILGNSTNSRVWTASKNRTPNLLYK